MANLSISETYVGEFELELTPRGVVRRTIELEERLGRLDANIGRQVEPNVREGFKANFEAQATGQGMPWKPLSESTLARRKSAGVSGSRILFVTGRYYRSWTLVRHPDSLFRFMPGRRLTEYEYGSKDPRTRLLEGGGRNAQGFKVPGRSVSIMPGAHETRIGQALDKIFRDMGDTIL